MTDFLSEPRSEAKLPSSIHKPVGVGEDLW